MTEPKMDIKSSAIMARVKALDSKRKSLLSLIQSLVELSKNVSTAAERKCFLMRTLTLDKTQAEYLRVIDQLNEAKQEANADFSPSYKFIETFDELICQILMVKADIQEQCAFNRAQEAGRPRLPPLSLIKFNGEIERWPAFADVFKRVVGSNPALSDSERVQYLVTHLSGSAAISIAGIVPSGENYALIWKTLEQKYEDVRCLAGSYLSRLLKFKSVSAVDVKQLNKFVDEFIGSVSAAKALNLDNLADFIFTYIALSKLPAVFVQSFEQTVGDTFPSFESLTEFTRKQIKIIERSDSVVKSSPHLAERDNKVPRIVGLHSHARVADSGCELCKGGHSIVKCKRFLDARPSDRYKIVKQHKLCVLCLKGHRSSDCNAGSRCNVCGFGHHSLLHFPKRAKSAERRTDLIRDENKTVSDTALVAFSPRVRSYPVRQAVLPTARVVLLGGKKAPASTLRVLIDSGSSSNFILEKTCIRLGLPMRSCQSVVTGLGNVTQPVLGYSEFSIGSRFNQLIKFHIHALVVRELTSSLPSVAVAEDFSSDISDLDLADETFAEPAEVDCILGATMFARILGPRKVGLPKCNLYAVESSLGFLIMGESQRSEPPAVACCSYVASADEDLEHTVRRFWTLESVPVRKLISPDELECEKYFEESLSRLSDGSFMVSLPFKEEPSALGNSRGCAERRLLALERKLDSDADLRAGYDLTFREYLDRGFLHPVSEASEPSLVYYIPHRAVYRPDKSSSKIRLVLDASSKTSSGKSLNDILHCGPNIQSSIFNLLLNFRLFEIALCADIEKMYFSIKVLPAHRRFLRVLYRFDGEGPVGVYEFSSLPMGLSPACYLAVKVLQRLFRDEDSLGLRSLLENSTCTYMDDYLLSLQTPEEAVDVVNRLTALHAQAGFKLTKWLSNSGLVMQTVSSSKGPEVLVNLDSEPNAKLVGLWWNPIRDVFLYKICSPDVSSFCTKRHMLSVTASLYDPLGFLAPVIAGFKVLIQECWKRDLGWDQEVPSAISDRWFRLVGELKFLDEISVPRHLGFAEGLPATLLCFCDASEIGLGAVVYVRMGKLQETSSVVTLVCAKSRLAPIKNVSLARLELCAALLLSQLAKAVCEEISTRVTLEPAIAFSDSTIALAWICSSPHRWHTFVANRVAAIQDVLPEQSWWHVPGKSNPSDVITRPPSPREFSEVKSWTTGPAWAALPAELWPAKRFSRQVSCQEFPECKPVSLVITDEPAAHPLDLLIERVSTWPKLLRSLVLVLRFCRILRSVGYVRGADRAAAESFIIRHVQGQHFAADLVCVTKGKSCRKPLRKLTPLLCDGVLCVGGRLEHAELSYRQRHPMLLPSRCRVSKLIVEYVHRANFHTGPGLLLALIRRDFWILSARGLIRKVVHDCNVCFRSRPVASNPLMGNLPKVRLTEAKSFLRSGVDYAGPLVVRMCRNSRIKLAKAYICLFVCLSTKAVHLELVSDLSTDLFVAAFKRFLARRGPVSLVLSDGGRNFLGAKRRLGELYALLDSSEANSKLVDTLASHRTEFRTNAPLAPNQGGLWEANVKSVKTHLYRVLGHQILTYEELNTLLVQIEALLNSRPLCVLSSDPNEPLALTPAHFLTLQPLSHFPAEDLTTVPLARVARFALVEKLVQSYWRRWRTEYISSLQTREKWNVPGKPLSIGQVVLVDEPNLSPLNWPLAVITELFPGSDGITRVVRIKTKNGSYVRPATRICVLPDQ